MERYTVRSNGRLGRLLLDAELSLSDASKAETDQARQRLSLTTKACDLRDARPENC